MGCRWFTLIAYVRYVPWKDYKAVTADLKKIYQSVTEDEALLTLDEFEKRWMGNTRKSAEAGERTGTASTPCLIILRISARPSTLPMRLNH